VALILGNACVDTHWQDPDLADASETDLTAELGPLPSVAPGAGRVRTPERSVARAHARTRRAVAETVVLEAPAMADKGVVAQAEALSALVHGAVAPAAARLGALGEVARHTLHRGARWLQSRSDAGRRYFVVQHSGRSYVVLNDDLAPTAGKGRPRWLDRGDEIVAVVREPLLPANAPLPIPVEGQRVVAVGPKGVCEARVKRLLVMKRFYFDYLTDPIRCRRQGRRRAAEDAWERGPEAWLVGELDGPSEACKTAHLVTSGVPTAAVPDEASDPLLEAAAVAAFRGLDAYREVQEELKDGIAAGDFTDVRPGVPWEAVTGGSLAVASYTDLAAGRRLVVVQGAADQGCGGFHGTLTAVFEAHAGQPLELLGEGNGVPSALVDHGSGDYELLYEDALRPMLPAAPEGDGLPDEADDLPDGRSLETPDLRPWVCPC
jgi:hypothetical protein